MLIERDRPLESLLDIARRAAAGYIGPGIDAKRRLELMKLAWDMTGSEFGSRAGLYERLYSGDPEINYQGMRVARAVTAQAMTGTVS